MIKQILQGHPILRLPPNQPPNHLPTLNLHSNLILHLPILPILPEPHLRPPFNQVYQQQPKTPEVTLRPIHLLRRVEIHHLVPNIHLMMNPPKIRNPDLNDAPTVEHIISSDPIMRQVEVFNHLQRPDYLVADFDRDLLIEALPASPLLEDLLEGVDADILVDEETVVGVFVEAVDVDHELDWGLRVVVLEHHTEQLPVLEVRFLVVLDRRFVYFEQAGCLFGGLVDRFVDLPEAGLAGWEVVVYFEVFELVDHFCEFLGY